MSVSLISLLFFAPYEHKKCRKEAGTEASLYSCYNLSDVSMTV